jgi:site-specific DNA recombinase
MIREKHGLAFPTNGIGAISASRTEYGRAQILERSRRGKRHRALQGVINVLSGAPYGYQYIRKSEQTSASYAVIDAEAAVVRMVYEHYTVRGLSIGASTRLLNEQGVPTRRGISRWERSTVWAMLRNPAYKGTACFNKAKSSNRQRITRPIRSRGESRHEIAPATSGHAPSGSRSQCPQS